jgi:hypothetical protein
MELVPVAHTLHVVCACVCVCVAERAALGRQLAGVVHRGGRAPSHAALGLSVEDLLPAERRDPYWRHLCSDRWPGGVYPECNHDAAAEEDYHKRLYLTYRAIGTLTHARTHRTTHVNAEQVHGRSSAEPRGGCARTCRRHARTQCQLRQA